LFVTRRLDRFEELSERVAPPECGVFVAIPGAVGQLCRLARFELVVTVADLDEDDRRAVTDAIARWSRNELVIHADDTVQSLRELLATRLDELARADTSFDGTRRRSV
jgi:hypothetical protein